MMNLIRYASRVFQRLILVALLSACAACGITYEKQTAAIAMSPDSDQVRVLVVYEGIRVSGDSDKDLSSAKSELKSFVQSGQKTCIRGLFFCFDLTGTGNMANLGRNHVAIRNGGFFLNPKGHLSGWQQITIRNAGKYVEAANSLLSEDISEMAAEGLQERLDRDRENTFDPLDDLTLVLMRRAARDRHQWIRVEPGRLSFTMIGSPEFFAKLKRLLLYPPEVEKTRQLLALAAHPTDGNEKRDAKEPTKHLRELEGLKERTQTLSENPWSFDQRRDRMTISLGYGGGEPIRIVDGTLSNEKSIFSDELREFARSLPVQFRDRASVDSIVAEFVASVDRSGK